MHPVTERIYKNQRPLKFNIGTKGPTLDIGGTILPIPTCKIDHAPEIRSKPSLGGRGRGRRGAIGSSPSRMLARPDCSVRVAINKVCQPRCGEVLHDGAYRGTMRLQVSASVVTREVTITSRVVAHQKSSALLMETEFSGAAEGTARVMAASARRAAVKKRN